MIDYLEMYVNKRTTKTTKPIKDPPKKQKKKQKSLPTQEILTLLCRHQLFTGNTS